MVSLNMSAFKFSRIAVVLAFMPSAFEAASGRITNAATYLACVSLAEGRGAKLKLRNK
jgi:hypothetical protein